MNLAELVDALEAAGATLEVKLRVQAPPGALDATLRAAVAEYRPHLLERLGREALWARLEGQRWGTALRPQGAGPAPPPRAGPREPGDDDDRETDAGWLREFDRLIGRADAGR